MLEPLLRLALGGAVAYTANTSMKETMVNLVVRLVGLLAALMLALAAFICLAAAAVIWALPPHAGVAEVMGILGAALLFGGLMVWAVFCQAKQPRRMLADAMADDGPSLNKAGHLVREAAEAFRRGWDNPTRH